MEERAETYREVRHPQTGRFLFAVDDERGLVLMVDRGKRSYVPVEEIFPKRIEQSAP